VRARSIYTADRALVGRSYIQGMLIQPWGSMFYILFQQLRNDNIYPEPGEKQNISSPADDLSAFETKKKRYN
jgi:hypothetical protein